MAGNPTNGMKKPIMYAIIIITMIALRTGGPIPGNWTLGNVENGSNGADDPPVNELTGLAGNTAGRKATEEEAGNVIVSGKTQIRLSLRPQTKDIFLLTGSTQSQDSEPVGIETNTV